MKPIDTIPEEVPS